MTESKNIKEVRKIEDIKEIKAAEAAEATEVAEATEEIQELKEAKDTKTMRRTVNHIFLWLLIYNAVTSVIMLLPEIFYLDTDPFLGYLVSVIIGVAIVYLCTLKKWPVQPFARTQKKMTVKDFLTIFGAFCITQLITLLVTMITAVAGIEGTSIDIGEVTLCFIIYGAFVGPFAEEMIYRGFTVGNGRTLGKIPAIILAAFAFGLMHGNLSQFIIGMLGGLVLGYVFVEYSIWWALLIHVINNTLGVALMMIPGENADFYGILFYVIFGIFSLYSIIQIIKRRDEVKAWFRDPDNHGNEGATFSILTSPWFIIFTVIYIAMIILLMVFPDLTTMMSAA